MKSCCTVPAPLPQVIDPAAMQPRRSVAREVADKSRSDNRIIMKRRHELIKIFELDQYPSISEREAIAAKLGVPYKKISGWFMNRRSFCKLKKAKAST